MSLLGTPIPLWWVVGFIVAYYIFSSAVGSLDAPDDKSSKGYRFWFKFLNRLAANWSRAAVALKLPGAAENLSDAPKQP